MIHVILAAAALAGSTHAETSRRLLLFGGGERPPQEMRRFVEWAGGAKARILVVPYATNYPEDATRDVSEQLKLFSPGRVEVAVSTTALANRGAEPFLHQLSRATAIFFTGGDQTRLMKVLLDHGLVKDIRARYRAGLPCAGTSAGTSAIGDPMLTGEGNFEMIDGAQVGTAPGVGLLENVILDQHFLKRKRANRLFGAIFAHPKVLGLGVDESATVLVEDERWAEVGHGAALVVAALGSGKESFSVEVLRPGQRYDLRERRRSNPPK